MTTIAAVSTTPAPRRRRSRANGTDAQVPLQGRVPVDVQQQARERAQRAGVSLGLYLEMLVRNEEVDEHGVPVWAHELEMNRAGGQQGELPITD